jgi:hypothetical protein
VIYSYEARQYPLFLEVRKGPRIGCTLQISIDGRTIQVKSYLFRGALNSLVSQLPQGASIKVPYHVVFVRNGAKTLVEIFEEVLFNRTNQQSNSFKESSTRLSVELEEKLYSTNFHEDIYDAIDELIGLIDYNRNVYFQLCPFCKFSNFHGTDMICLRDSAVLQGAKAKEKHIGDEIYKDSYARVDEFHCCSSFEKEEGRE